MSRSRLCDVITVKLTPATREGIEQVAGFKELTISELIRAYIMEGLSRDGIVC